MADRSGASRALPTSTYRLQLHADFTLDDARARVPYLASLGVSHLYLSPILEAAPGSMHGYDVVDHSRISEALGGEDGLHRLADEAHAHGLGIVVDIVPNHMAVPTPVWRNKELWSTLAMGEASPFAHWFDVDWSAGNDALLMPVLGMRIGKVLASGELTLDDPNDEEREALGDAAGSKVLRYYDHAFPVAAGTENLPMAELLDRQHYRLAWWKTAAEELNYRRFFDVDTLAAVRVEDDRVFDATHETILALVRDGTIDGLRIDHPDGLADPKGYLEDLHEATDGAWVVVEKILEHDESLPDDWKTAGTTGYDAQWRVQLAFVDAGGANELGAVMYELAGDPAGSLPAMIESAKREIVEHMLQAEVHRLVTLASGLCRDDIRLRDHGAAALRDCFVELLCATDRYRYYVVPGEPMRGESAGAFAACVERAREHLDEDRHETLDVLAHMLKGEEAGSAGRTEEPRRHELMVRFQQVCGPVMAKAVEDTAFYRWSQLTGLNEVGGAPERFAIGPDELHAYASESVRRHPHAMTTLSTHDTKRSEDVRSRLSALSELSQEWRELVHHVREATRDARSALVDGRMENFVWQTLAGTWTEAGPLSKERLHEYFTKAMREAKSHTTWTAQDADYEAAIFALIDVALDHEEVIEAFGRWVHRSAAPVRATTLGTKLLQLTLPGIPDVYQGTEVPSIALVDPDNRRPVDYDELARRLERLDAPRGDDTPVTQVRPADLADEKLLVTSRALRVREAHTEAFVGDGGGYRAVAASSGNAFAFARTVHGEDRVVVVATRLAASLERHGGWQAHTVVLPEGRWTSAFDGRTFDGGELPLGELLDAGPVPLPVALLTRTDVSP